MNMVVWRLHRYEAFLTTAASLAVAAVLVITGVPLAHRFARCEPAGIGACYPAFAKLLNNPWMTRMQTTMKAVPLLLGMFLGAPLLPREFAGGTHQLMWTQGVTRRRWLGGTIAWAMLSAALWAGVIAAVVTWWRIPENAIGIAGNRLMPGNFDMQGIVPVAYALFAVALGIAAGATMRRLVPAIATTFIVFVAVRFAVATRLRAHFVAPLTKLETFGGGGGGGINVTSGAWLLSGRDVGPTGASNSVTAARALGCLKQVPDGVLVQNACMAQHGWKTALLFQPASRFWTLQAIESAVFIALAAALVAWTFRIVLARDA